MIGAILFPAGVAVVLLKGGGTAPSEGQPLRQSPPSPFEPIHGIVRQTDSLRPKRAQNMKSHAQTIENQC